MTLLSEGDRDGATRHFQSCLDTYVLPFYARHWSRAFLERMKRDPTWPPWIPVKDAAAVTQPESEPAGDAEGG